MAFERLRQQQAAEEIARQQREKAAADAVRIKNEQRMQAEQKRQAALQPERDRIEAERQKALVFREESGVVGKLREFVELARELKLVYGEIRLVEDDPNYRTKPSGIADRLAWHDSLIKSDTRRGSLISYGDDGSADIYEALVTELREEKYLVAETFPDGRINIAGSVPLLTIFGIGVDGYSKSLARRDWYLNGQPNPTVFETPIHNAYKRPGIRRYTHEYK